MESVWSERFSKENIESYAWACVSLYESAVRLHRQGFTTLVNPSRGATPFLQTMSALHLNYGKKNESDNDVLTLLNRPFAGREIMLPFTADPPVGHDGDGATAQIRDYWVRVLKAYLLGDVYSPEIQFYQYVTLGLLGFEQNIGAPTRRPSENFVFVDTVISGRSICEIEESFQQHGLINYHLLLLVEGDGAQLNGWARKKLFQLQAEGKATLIFLRDLLTEDQGPALTGTWCLNVPQLMTMGAEALSPADQDLVGAAACFIRVSNRPGFDNRAFTVSFSNLMVMLHSLLSQDEILDGEVGVSESFRESLIESISSSKVDGFVSPLDKSVTERIVQESLEAEVSLAIDRTPLPRNVGVEVSSSHVIRLRFDEDAVRRKISEFERRRSEPAFWYRHSQ